MLAGFFGSLTLLTFNDTDILKYASLAKSLTYQLVKSNLKELTQTQDTKKPANAGFKGLFVPVNDTCRHTDTAPGTRHYE